MRILILGASSYAGQAIAKALINKYEVYGTYYTQKTSCLDENKMFQMQLEDTDSIKKILDQIQPQIIISSLRGDFQLQLGLHTIAADYLLSMKGGKMIFISSSNVFDGAMEKPHYESDKTYSQSDYGNFKIKCEQLLQGKLNERCVIVRIPQIYGKNSPRILKLAEDTKDDRPIDTYPQFYVNYTTDIQIAEWIAYIIKEDLGGVFHIGTKDTCDYMWFQLELSKILELKEPIFQKEESLEKCFQAVIPGRAEIPDDLQRSVTDVLEYLGHVQE
ncbi:sugar nucleotide-binding protein [Lacrimispora sp.]|uniref:sugar nucleotide-binding protein n=1 Tax=Lacrimispora sp. TaxID=2719234 RepID=UPI0032E38424